MGCSPSIDDVDAPVISKRSKVKPILQHILNNWIRQCNGVFSIYADIEHIIINKFLYQKHFEIDYSKFQRGDEVYNFTLNIAVIGVLPPKLKQPSYGCDTDSYGMYKVVKFDDLTVRVNILKFVSGCNVAVGIERADAVIIWYDKSNKEQMDHIEEMKKLCETHGNLLIPPWLKGISGEGVDVLSNAMVVEKLYNSKSKRRSTYGDEACIVAMAKKMVKVVQDRLANNPFHG